MKLFNVIFLLHNPFSSKYMEPFWKIKYPLLIMPISIIIPIHKDETNNILKKCIRVIFENCFNAKNLTEIIIVSSTKFPKIIHKKIKQLIDPSFCTRAKAMNHGFMNIQKNNIAIFLHVDTSLPKNYDLLILEKMKKVNFCYFQLKFDNNHPLFKVIEYQVNYIRHFPYGDQCFCVKYNFHKNIGMFDDIPFMEDYQYVLKISKKDRTNNISENIITGARRYKDKNGFSFSSIINNVLNNKNLIELYNKKYDVFELEKIYYKNGLLGYYY